MYLPEDLYPQVLNKLNLPSARLLTKSTMESRNEEFNLSKRNYVLSFIYQSFTENDFSRITQSINRHYIGEWYYDTYDDFLKHQEEVVFELDDITIKYCLDTINLIKNFDIQQIDRYQQSFDNKQTKGFCFILGKLTFLTVTPKKMLF